VYPQTTVAISALLKQSSSTIESVVVTAQSQTTTVTLIAENENQNGYVVSEFVTSNQTATLVEQHVIKTIEIVTPKPIITIAVSPQIITSIPTF
jgi:ABC-type phosphate transport system substrate-binding protein